MNHFAPFQDVPSPCIQVCALDGKGVCTGCFRTMAEITEWPTATRARKIEIRRAAELRGRVAAYHRRSPKAP
ncbi:MAG: DUF1289 domain-containing protein [Pseudomonadota bacterium]